MPVQTYQPGQQPQPVVMGQVVQGGYTGGHVVQGVPYRVDPNNANISTIPALQKYPQKRQDAKLQEIRNGASLLQQFPPLPDSRPWRDAFWILPFLAVLIAGIAVCFQYVSRDIFKVENANSDDYPTVPEIVIAGAISGVASLVVAFGYLNLAKVAPGCVVWTSLLLGPMVAIAVGVAMIAIGLNSGGAMIILGLIMIMLGCCSLFCVFFCWADLIPFMIKLTEVVAGIIVQHPSLFLVSLFGSVLGIAWSLIMGLAFYGVYTEFEEHVQESSRGVQYAIYFGVALVFFWGGYVAINLAHVTYCGVFGRWYYKKEESSVVRSFTVATTTSFGSICFGSFLIAAIRALEFMIRQMRRDAAEDGNWCCCIILCVVECVISCIGDLLEYFSEWAYVQVAVRGCDFMSAVRITYSMMNLANIDYIIRDLLLDSVVGTGTLLCTGVAVAVGGGVGYAQGTVEKAVAGAIVGLFAGLVAGSAAVGIISSGVKSILALWAESPQALQQTRPEIHDEFDQRIRRSYGS